MMMLTAQFKPDEHAVAENLFSRGVLRTGPAWLAGTEVVGMHQGSRGSE